MIANTQSFKRHVSLSTGDKVFAGINYLFLTIIVVCITFPLLFVVSASISNPEAVISGKVLLLPAGFSMQGYKAVFKSTQIFDGYLNSLFYTIAGTCINIFLTVLAAYPLSAKHFKPRKFFMLLFVIVMICPGGMIPKYLNVKELHLLNSRWAMLLPEAISVWNLIIMRTYFETSIPYDLYEASWLDGCSDVRILTSVILPLSKPILAVIALYYGVAHWNSYFNAMLYLNKADLYPLQIVLRNILLLYTNNSNVDPELLANLKGISQSVRYAVIVVASLPLLLLYPFLQKYFVKGVMLGAVKG